MTFECLAADKDRFIFAAHALAAHVTAKQSVHNENGRPQLRASVFIVQ